FTDPELTETLKKEVLLFDGTAPEQGEILEEMRAAIAEEVQKIAYDEVLYVPWGQFVVPGAFRKNVQGLLEFGATLLWNISL
ncbi:MAG: hypothetical protein ACRELS_20080, partial [Candidatus Rokuibacteriota bacterium]